MMNKIVNKLMKKMKNKIVPLILSIIAVVSILSQTTYSLLFKEYETDEQSYATGVLEITSNKNSDSVTLVNSFPMEDEDAMEMTPYVFTITNTGNLTYKFNVKFLSTTTTNMVSPQYIKIKVNDNEPVILSSLTDGIILEDVTLEPENSIEIELRVWLDIHTPNTEIGKVFNAKIVTEGNAIYDTLLVTDEVLEANKTVTSSDYTWSSSTPGMTELTLSPGTYKLETWGAQGGSLDSDELEAVGTEEIGHSAGGLGGYSYGIITLAETTTAYIYVGGQPVSDYTASSNASDSTAGGFNGGGDGGNYCLDTQKWKHCGYGQGGGGASDIRIGTDSLYARVIVAGGGSGGNQGETGHYGGGHIGGIGDEFYVSPADQTSAYGNGEFGVGGSCASGNEGYGCSGGGGGWYGGTGGEKCDDNDGCEIVSEYYTGSGGSGYVYTSSTASNYPSGGLLNSSYYLTNAATIGDGTTSFTDFDGSTVTGHSGNGAVRISGAEQVTTYTIPRLTGLTDLSINLGESYDLTSDVTLICEDGETECSLIKTSVTDTSTLSAGKHVIYYIVKDASGEKYKYPRTINVAEQLGPESVLTNLGLTDILNEGTPDFSTVATTDEGIYSAQDDLGTSYYFRGASTRNYVKFGKNSSNQDMYWRIIRINGDGTIRMIYDGTSAHANGTVSEDKRIDWDYFSNYTHNAHVGYMYGTPGSSTYELEHANINNSTVKTILEGELTSNNTGWYYENIINTGYEEYVADAIYCNDRTLYSGTGVTEETIYGASPRVYNTPTSPILTCQNPNDRFTIEESTLNTLDGLGTNKKNKYPIGLITSDESVMAGATTDDSNENFYLYSGDYYWTMSPEGFYALLDGTSMFYISSEGLIHASLFVKESSTNGIRPVISLKADVLKYDVSTSNGTKDYPFILK